MAEEVIRARIDADLKKAFETACEAKDRTASQVIRDMIREFVRENAQGSLIGGKRKR